MLLAGHAGGEPRPGVELFSPLGSVERVEQIKLRFNTPMVAFGDPRLAAPLTGNRSAGATGRWVDARTFAVDLPAPLPGDQRCSYTLVPGLKDASAARSRRDASISTPADRTFARWFPNPAAARSRRTRSSCSR